MVGWTPSSQPVEVPKPKAPPRFIRPPVFVEDEEVPPSPREVVPHRSAGYGSFYYFTLISKFPGPAHQKRKLSIPDRSRSASPQKQPTAVVTDFDKYAKYERHRKGLSYVVKKASFSRFCHSLRNSMGRRRWLKLISTS